jgi:hypothetical protein
MALRTENFEFGFEFIHGRINTRWRAGVVVGALELT